MRLVRTLTRELRRRVTVEALHERTTVSVAELRRNVLGVHIQVVEHVARAEVTQLVEGEARLSTAQRIGCQ